MTTVDGMASSGLLPDALRSAARRFATGVTVVGLSDGDVVHGLTANSFVTLSLRPALIGLAVHTDGRMRGLIERVGRFGVSVLGQGQAEFARHYASRDRGRPPEGLALLPAGTVPPVPYVPGSVAFFGCSLHEIHPVGDHDLLIGQVWSCDVLDGGQPPLIFLDGRFHRS